ncbi:MAG TPA: hypothetical protein VN784_13195 [Candidatus Limnocylindrales bacterium]|nr:hypothetical protein [Candidatus Limnocylindrales bacterium]
MCESIEKMLPVIEKAFQLVIGALISGFIGVWLFFHKRKRDTKDSFLVFVSQQRIRVEAIRDSSFLTKDFQGFHTKSRQEFMDAVARVWPFLNRRNKSRIKTLWTKYDQIPSDELDSKWEVGALDVAFEKRFPEKGTPEKPSAKLLHYLGEFENAAR